MHRWLLVYSEQTYVREAKTMKRQVQKEKDEANRELKQGSLTILIVKKMLKKLCGDGEKN